MHTHQYAAQKTHVSQLQSYRPPKLGRVGVSCDYLCYNAEGKYDRSKIDPTSKPQCEEDEVCGQIVVFGINESSDEG